MPEVSDFTGIQSGTRWPIDSDYGVPVIIFSPDFWTVLNDSILANDFPFDEGERTYFDETMVQAPESGVAALREAVATWESLAGIQIVEQGYYPNRFNDHPNAVEVIFGAGENFQTEGIFGQYPPSVADDTVSYIYFNSETNFSPSAYIFGVSFALGLKRPDTESESTELTLTPSLDNQDITLMSQNGPWTNTEPRPLDIQAMQDLYGAPGSPTNFVNRLTSSHELLMISDAGGDLSPFLGNLRDFGGNTFGAAGDWALLGQTDIQGDGDIEGVIVNTTLGRWGTLGPDENDIIDFLDHGAGGDTRVVGTYIDPLVARGQVEAGSGSDSQQRFANDLLSGNLGQVLGADDYDNDGFQELYFALSSGNAVLHAYMHADGNIRYANYQSEADLIAFMDVNGVAASVYDDWF